MALVDRMGPIDALPHELTAQDRRESGSRGYNPYALGIVLGAADNVRAAVARGTPFVDAFINAFNPTRGMHAVARRLGLPLSVERGCWIKEES